MDTEFCDYCDLEVMWDEEDGWVDIADGAKTLCDGRSSGFHEVAT